MEQNHFNRKLRQLREEKNLTQEQIANALGIKRSTYAYLEHEVKRPSLEMLEKLSRLFLVSVNDLTGDPPKKNSPFPTFDPEIYVLNDHSKKENPKFIRDLMRIEQDMILAYRLPPEEEQAKIINYINRIHKNNIKEEKNK